MNRLSICVSYRCKLGITSPKAIFQVPVSCSKFFLGVSTIAATLQESTDSQDLQNINALFLQGKREQQMSGGSRGGPPEKSPAKGLALLMLPAGSCCSKIAARSVARVSA